MEKPNNTPTTPSGGCQPGQGTLPGTCAPMAFPFIAMQEENPVRYSRMEALQTGTLFPGLDLPFKADIRRPDRDNTIDVYIGDECMDVLADGAWQQFFTEKPEEFTREERRQWLSGMTGVALGSDAFFPFGDNIERARRSGVTAIVQPGGSIRDQQVIDTCNKYGIAMAFCGLRLFHH